MRAVLMVLVSMLAMSGCRSLEREGANPLPENGPPLSYMEMLNRARGQAASALDAFYVDGWLELEQSAQRLEQSARLLPKATNIPEPFKGKIDAEADFLRKDATKLIEAARAKNATQANESMQRINHRIRQLRPNEPTDKMPEMKKLELFD